MTADNFIGAIEFLLGEPNSFAADVLIYTLGAILLIRILEMIFAIIFSLIRKV